MSKPDGGPAFPRPAFAPHDVGRKLICCGCEGDGCGLGGAFTPCALNKSASFFGC